MLAETLPEKWPALLTSAMLGLDRRPLDAPLDNAGLFAQIDTDDSSHTFLLGAAVASLQRRAGQQPTTAPALIPAAPPETRLRCSARAAFYLDETMRRGIRLLTEWLVHVGRRGQRVPHVLLPPLFDMATDWKHLSPGVAQVGGERGRWLAGQNPRWAHIGEVSANEARAFLSSTEPPLKDADAKHAMETTSDTVPYLTLVRLLSAHRIESADLVAALLDHLMPKLDSHASRTTAQTLEQLVIAVTPQLLHALIARLRTLQMSGASGLETPLQTAEFRLAMLKEINRD